MIREMRSMDDVQTFPDALVKWVRQMQAPGMYRRRPRSEVAGRG